MKRKLLFAALFIVCAYTFTSCEDTCKVCKQVTYIDEAPDHEGPSSEFCGAELIAIESMDDIVIGNTRTAWECD